MIYSPLVYSSPTPVTCLLWWRANTEPPTIMSTSTFAKPDAPVICHLDVWPSESSIVISYLDFIPTPNSGSSAKSSQLSSLDESPLTESLVSLSATYLPITDTTTYYIIFPTERAASPAWLPMVISLSFSSFSRIYPHLNFCSLISESHISSVSHPWSPDIGRDSMLLFLKLLLLFFISVYKF